MKKAHLSKTQAHVLDRMRNGWELGRSEGMNVRHWLQRGGIGRGGITERVSYSTVHALLSRRLIKWTYTFPTSMYTLTEEQR